MALIFTGGSGGLNIIARFLSKARGSVTIALVPEIVSPEDNMTFTVSPS